MNIKSKLSLCESCQHYSRVTYGNGVRDGRCHYMDNVRVGEMVTECTAYDSFLDDPPYAMEKAAWIIEKDKRGQVAGFVPPKTNKQRNGTD